MARRRRQELGSFSELRAALAAKARAFDADWRERLDMSSPTPMLAQAEALERGDAVTIPGWRLRGEDSRPLVPDGVTVHQTYVLGVDDTLTVRKEA